MEKGNSSSTPSAKGKSAIVIKSRKSPKKTEKTTNTSRVQYRSNLKGVIAEIKGLSLTNEHIESIKRYCPFWKLVKLIIADRITLKSTTKRDTEVTSLLGKFNRATKTFNMAGKSLALTKEDVTRAFGVKRGKREVFTSTDKCVDSSFYKNFEGIGRLATTNVSIALREAVKSEGIAASDNVAQLMTLHMLTVLFVPSKSSLLSWGYNKILSNVAEINSYDWLVFRARQ